MEMKYINGSPRDRGSADRYYGRLFEPHYYPSGTYKGYRVTKNEMSPEQVSEYTLGWEEETARKDWG